MATTMSTYFAPASTQKDRKIKKKELESQRRGTTNYYLSELKKLVADDADSGSSKLLNNDVLRMAVSHIHRLKNSVKTLQSQNAHLAFQLRMNGVAANCFNQTPLQTPLTQTMPMTHLMPVAFPSPGLPPVFHPAQSDPMQFCASGSRQCQSSRASTVSHQTITHDDDFSSDSEVDVENVDENSNEETFIDEKTPASTPRAPKRSLSSDDSGFGEPTPKKAFSIDHLLLGRQ